AVVVPVSAGAWARPSAATVNRPRRARLQIRGMKDSRGWKGEGLHGDHHFLIFLLLGRAALDCTAYSSDTMPVLYTLWPVSFSLVCLAGGGTSVIPPPRSTGMTATSTVSTSPASSILRKSKPPPNSQMSLPEPFRRAATVSSTLS